MTTSSIATKVFQSSPAEYSDGVAFRFQFPKGTCLSLRAVDIKDGIPKLRFSTSNKVPSISEEDVAVGMRLALEKKRPEFYYTHFPEDHPLSDLGRNYKYYKPPYLRGTSVGEDLAEADWRMKCVHVGVMNDGKKEKFQSLSESNRLNGLATRESFPREGLGAQVLMHCESVDVSENDNEMIFVGEPTMKISDSGSSSYTEYITKNFDNIAYHSEPSFLKVKELMKLMLAMEWLRDKGVQFSEEWINSHCKRPTKVPRKPMKVSFTESEKGEILQEMQEGVNKAMDKLPPIVGVQSTSVQLSHSQVSLLAAEKTFSESGVELRLETMRSEPIFKAFTGLDIPLVIRVTARSTIDDFDFLYAGMDPNQPVHYEFDGKGTETKDLKLSDLNIVKPEVESWSELFAETMPYPCKVIEDPDGKIEPVELIGGCATSTIPVRKMVPPATPVTETATVRASRARKQEKIVCSKKYKVGETPPTKDVHRAPIEGSLSMEIRKGREKFGWSDSSSSHVSSSNGEVTELKPSLHGMLKVTQLIGGKEFGPPIYLNMHLLQKPKEGKDVPAIECDTCRENSPDDGYSSMQCLAAN